MTIQFKGNQIEDVAGFRARVRQTSASLQAKSDLEQLYLMMDALEVDEPWQLVRSERPFGLRGMVAQ